VLRSHILYPKHSKWREFTSGKAHEKGFVALFSWQHNIRHMFEQAILFAIALVANTFSALAGGGAGLIQLPALLLLGLPFSVALATHKIASVALGLGAVARYLKEDLC